MGNFARSGRSHRRAPEAPQQQAWMDVCAGAMMQQPQQCGAPFSPGRMRRQAGLSWQGDELAILVAQPYAARDESDLANPDGAIPGE